VLESNREVFVHGWTYKQDNKRIAVVSRGVPLIVSMKTKDAYLEDFAVGDSFFYTHNFLLYIGVILLYLAINHFFPISVAFLLVALAGITARMVIQIRNRMVVLRNRIRNAESQIAIEMRKRADLVPQLEEVIKEYRNYERNVFEKLNAIRKMILSAEPGLEKPATKLDKLVKSIENYPRLKASENFQHFADCITRIESSIAYYRGFYNKTILKYNSLIHSVPFNLFAMIFGFKSKGYLK
jgi:LemA protein